MTRRPIHLPRSRLALRRCAAAVLLAWLNLLVQPCLAAPRPAVGATEHCPHAMGPGADMPCHAMQVDDCGESGAVNVDAPGAAPAALWRQAGFAAPDSGQRATGAGAVAPGGTGPPLHIRFCSLSN